VGNEVNLLEINFGGYILLVIIGLVGSSALVVPGISGSMLLLILGYYNPLVKLITDHLLKGKDFGRAIAVLGCTAFGIVVGFFIISIIMKWLLKNCPRGTYFAILGFIIGSIPTVYISTAKESGITFSTLPTSVWHWAACILLLAIGVALSFSLVLYSKKKNIINE
jgi:putative membrane protein